MQILGWGTDIIQPINMQKGGLHGPRCMARALEISRVPPAAPLGACMARPLLSPWLGEQRNHSARWSGRLDMTVSVANSDL